MVGYSSNSEGPTKTPVLLTWAHRGSMSIFFLGVSVRCLVFFTCVDVGRCGTLHELLLQPSPAFPTRVLCGTLVLGSILDRPNNPFVASL